MRTFSSGLLTLVAMVAIVIAFPSLWAQERLVDQGGFVAMITPMSGNQQVKDYIAEEVTDAAAQRIGSPASSRLIEPAVHAYTDSPEYRSDFVDVVSQQHAWLFDPPPAHGDTTVMQLDITRMVNRVISKAGLPVQVTDRILVPLNRGGGSGLEAGRYHDIGRRITDLALGSLTTAVLAGLLALLIARRRGTVLAWLGISGVASAAVAWGLGILFANRAKQEVSGADSTGHKVAELIIDGLQHDLHHLALIVGAVGLGVMGVGMLIRLFERG